MHHEIGHMGEVVCLGGWTSTQDRSLTSPLHTGMVNARAVCILLECILLMFVNLGKVSYQVGSFRVLVASCKCQLINTEIYTSDLLLFLAYT